MLFYKESTEKRKTKMNTKRGGSCARKDHIGMYGL